MPPARAHAGTAQLREDILAGLRAAEDRTIGDMTAEQLLAAYDAARRSQVLKDAADELAGRVPPATAGPRTEHDRKLLFASREVQKLAEQDKGR